MKLALAVLLIASPAAAERTKCMVTIARAPEDVRPIVERWVQTEPTCELSLEVRIVPTEGGYYMFAEDENHRVRERLVPDAESAGVLIVSWIADDKMPTPTVVATPELRAPSHVAATKAVEAKPEETAKWLSIAAMLGVILEDGSGVAAEVDIAAWRSFTFGVAASWLRGTMTVVGFDTGHGELEFSDSKVFAYAAHTHKFGKWQLREQLGVGGMLSTGNVFFPSSPFAWSPEVAGASPTVGLSAMFGRELGDNFAIAVGLAAAYIQQNYGIIVEGQMRELTRRDIDLLLTTSVRYRL